MFEVRVRRVLVAIWMTDDFDTDRYTGKTDSFVELKTSLSIRGPHDEAKFEKYDFPKPFQSIDRRHV